MKMSIENWWNDPDRENRITCLNSTLCTTNLSWTRLGSNTVLRREKQATKRLNHDRVFTISNFSKLYRVIQEETSIFWKVIEKVIVGKRNLYEHLSNYQYGCQDRAVVISQWKAMRIVKKKRKLLIIICNYNLMFKRQICDRNEKELLHFTANIRKIPLSVSINFASRVRRSHFVLMSWSSLLFTRAAAPKMRTSNSSRVSTRRL